MNEMVVFVGVDGLLQFVYSDELLELLSLGNHAIDRASHVEPTPLGWEADLSPVGGPTLGPFARRDSAIDAEVTWLNDRIDDLSLRH